MRESRNTGNLLKANFISDFRDLDVYKTAYQTALAVHKLAINFPQHEQYGGIADQLRRSSKSITANVAEGFGKQRDSKKEFKRFLSMACGSCFEVQSWLEYAVDLSYLTQAEYEELFEAYRNIERMLFKLKSNIRE